MELNLFKNILTFFNQRLYGDKVSPTGFRYTGLLLNDFFDNSVLQFDFLTLDFYLNDIEGKTFDEGKDFLSLYLNIPEDKRILLIEKILKILKHTSYNKNENLEIILIVSNFLKNYNYTIVNNQTTLEILKSRFIGEGSYCNVFEETERTVRKTLKPEYLTQENFKRRLKYEFENTLKLKDSPNIIKVIEYDAIDNSYLMEKCDGDLHAFRQKNIEILHDKKIQIAFDILNGMKYAHDNNIIHRDLHLGNILQIKNNFVISDFGWSKDLDASRSLKSSSSPKSSNRYVAPEAISNFNNLDKKTDIYSIGQILDDIFRNTLSSNHEYSSIINKCIERDRERRYQNIDMIINDFNTLLQTENEELTKATTLQNIIDLKFTIQVQNFILNLAKESLLSYFIVEHKLHNFGKLILQFIPSEQDILMNSIKENFPNATGSNGWNNYDLFTDIAYDIYTNNEVTKNIKNTAYNIIKFCASDINRFHAQKIIENESSSYFV